MIRKILLSFLALILMSGVTQAIDVSACGTLGTNGATYNIIQDLSSISGDCLTVTASDYILNGNGHNIKTTDTTSSAIYIHDSSGGTLSNFTVNDNNPFNDYTISLLRASQTTISNFSTNNSYYGINMDTSHNISLAYFNISNNSNDYGVNVLSSSYNITMTHFTADYERTGFRISGSNVTVSDFSTNYSVLDGFMVDSSSHNVTISHFYTNSGAYDGLNVAGAGTTLSDYVSTNNVGGNRFGGNGLTSINASIYNNGYGRGTNGDIDLTSGTQYFVNLKLDTFVRIYIYSNPTQVFDVNNSGIELKTNISSANNVFDRRVILWTRDEVKWNDNNATGSITAYYNVSGLAPNSNYTVTDNGENLYKLQSDNSGVLPQFSIALTGGTDLISVKMADYQQALYNTGWQLVEANSTMTMSEMCAIFGCSWESRWNTVSTPKFDTYKSGMNYKASQTLNAGDAVMIKVSSNKIINRIPNSGTFNWNAKEGWNLWGNEKNYPRTLGQINASINSEGTCDVDKLSYINPNTQAQYDFFCGQSGNGNIEVGMGEGFWANAKFDFNRART